MSRYKNIPAGLFGRNRQKLCERIGQSAVIVVFSASRQHRTGDQYYGYRQNSDFFYLTGIEEPGSVLVMCPQHPDETCRETLFTIIPDEKTKIWYGNTPTNSELSEISAISSIKPVESLNSFIDDMLCFSNRFYISFEANIRTTPGYNLKSNEVLNDFQNQYHYADFQNLDPVLKELRLVKEYEEISLIKQACRITRDAFSVLTKSVKPDKYEYEVESVITQKFIASGASDHAYLPIVASGSNACVLHYNRNDSLMINGDLVLLDFGAEYANYAADCSRTIPVNGRFSARQALLYNAVLSVFRQLKPEYKPGNTINILNEMAGILMQEEMLRIGLLSQEDIKNQDAENKAYKKYFMHGVSHFLGLDVHDVGDKETKLLPGMVLTCEPGLYLPGEKLGIRIENDILVDDYPIDLMADIPVEINEIEDLMA